MKWRNPKEELPNDDDKVAIMLEPHKVRGSLKDSLQSVQVIFGEYIDGIVDEPDELGYGWQVYTLSPEIEDKSYHNHRAIAWMPVEDFILPDFIK